MKRWIYLHPGLIFSAGYAAWLSSQAEDFSAWLIALFLIVTLSFFCCLFDLTWRDYWKQRDAQKPTPLPQARLL